MVRSGFRVPSLAKRIAARVGLELEHGGAGVSARGGVLGRVCGGARAAPSRVDSVKARIDQNPSFRLVDVSCPAFPGVAT